MSTNENPNSSIREVSNFINSKTIHEEGVKSQHWQLKNMLKLSGNFLVYPFEQSILAYDYNTKIKDVILPRLRFPPTSLFIDQDYIVVGGHKGQIVVLNRLTQEKLVKRLTEAINNHIIIRNNKIHVASNDRTLKIFDTDLQLIKKIEHTSQVNYCSISPDGKYLIIVGDSNDVIVYSNKTYELIKKLKTIRDGGFSVSWNSTSDVFAVGTQDGYVCLWDIRQDDKQYLLSSSQIGSHKGAIRNVFFTIKNSLDLLCFTEQFNNLTMFDTRTFAKKQVVNLYNDAQITGAVYSEEKSKIFVSSDEQITELDINTVCRRQFDA